MADSPGQHPANGTPPGPRPDVATGGQTGLQTGPVGALLDARKSLFRDAAGVEDPLVQLRRDPA